MKLFTDKISLPKWMLILLVFIPFTGIIKPGWFVILVFAYFFGLIYLLSRKSEDL